MAARIETPRLILRGWREEDREPWVAMNLDPRVREFFATAYTRELALSRAAQWGRELEETGYGWWVVEAREGPPLVGAVCLRDVPFEAHFTPAREIGWRLAPAQWGKGYATEAARALLGFAFDELGWEEVVAITAVPNVRSARVMERIGMTRDLGGDFDHPLVEPGHPLGRHVLYRILRASTERNSRVCAVARAALTRNTSVAAPVALDRFEEARKDAGEALTLARQQESSLWTAFALQHLAATQALSGDRARAARLLGFVDARLAQLEQQREHTEEQEHRRILAALRGVTNGDELERLMAEGASWAEEKAVAEALAA